MRRYDDPVEVRRGRIEGGQPGEGQPEGPEQFLWRGRLWKVRAVLAHWVETGAWWQSPAAREAIGSDDPDGPSTAPDAGAPDAGVVVRPDLLAERELWRVEAASGMTGPPAGSDEPGGGVFDLSFDWNDGTWQLVGCLD